MLCNLLSVLVSSYDLSFVPLFTKVTTFLSFFFLHNQDTLQFTCLYKAPHVLEVFFSSSGYTIVRILSYSIFHLISFQIRIYSVEVKSSPWHFFTLSIFLPPLSFTTLFNRLSKMLIYLQRIFDTNYRLNGLHRGGYSEEGQIVN